MTEAYVLGTVHINIIRVPNYVGTYVMTSFRLKFFTLERTGLN